MTTSAMSRREFAAAAGASAATLALGSGAFSQTPKPRTNVLLITLDDAHWASFGCTGSKTPGISPHIDRLAAEGMILKHAHVASAICQPSRSAIGTGRYPHRNGALGFGPINTSVPTIVETLKAAGYHTGIMAKSGHMTPKSKFPWDSVIEGRVGRDPVDFGKQSKAFFEAARAADKPFFLMANSQDPHRPFPGSEGELTRKKGPIEAGDPSRVYKASEIEVPGFLPQNVPDIETEIAQYYTGLHRADDSVGRLLASLKEAGRKDDTIVLLMSDNGISVPFAKTNCFENSTRTPLIVRWPGHVKPGSVDDEHFVSGIDLMPTILDAIGVPQVKGMDGRSILPILEGKKQPGFDKVFTFITSTSAGNEYPMRSVRNASSSYIFNAWADGKTEFRNEPMSGLTWNAMKAAGEKDPAVAKRCEYYLHRVREEFYDLKADPNELNNLITDPARQSEITKLRGQMLEMMKSTSDPLLEQFEKVAG